MVAIILFLVIASFVSFYFYSLSDFIVDSREDFFSDFKRKEGTSKKDK